MSSLIGRRSLLAAGGSALAFASGARAQTRTRLRFSAVFPEQDIRAEAMRMFAQDIGQSFNFEPFLNASLFRQGTELVAMQRGNLEMGIIPPQDISNQIPAWSILTAAYLFRDPAHLRATLRGEIGQQMYRLASNAGIQILGPVYFGTRQVNLKPRRRINTPADMAGIKLRMPAGEAWQFLGTALGANPTPVAFAEVYTALQTGAIDGQDNPLPLSRVSRFHEVTTQFVLTSHLVGFDLLAIAKPVWDAMPAAQQTAFQAAADRAIDWSTARHVAQEAELVTFFRGQGLDVYEPDVNAFRTNAQRLYLASPLAQGWPAGMLDRINAVR